MVGRGVFRVDEILMSYDLTVSIPLRGSCYGKMNPFQQLWAGFIKFPSPCGEVVMESSLLESLLDKGFRYPNPHTPENSEKNFSNS
jgi:hypothetical protein